MSFERLPPGLATALLLGVAVLVAVLYWLRPPARAVVVASTLPWLRLAERSKRTRRWRRLLSLLLSLAAASSVALALGGLRVAPPGADRPPLVVVIDTSATMATAAPGGGIRLDRAVAEARGEIARSVGPIDLYDTTGQLAHAGLPIAAALELLGGLRVHPARPAVFPVAAAAVTDDPRPRRRLLISDGVAAPEAPDGFERVSVWSPAVNVGLVAFEAARSGERLEAFVEVLNGSTGPVVTDLLLDTVDGDTLVRRPLELAPAERWSGVIDLAPLRELVASSPVLHARLRTPDDALALDDQAWAPVPLGAPLRVGVAGAEQATAVRRALALLPGIEVRPLTPEEADRPTGLDLLVLEEVAPEDPPPLPALLVDPPERSWLPEREEQLGPSAWSAVRPPGALPDRVTDALLDVRVESITRYAAPGLERVVGVAAQSAPGSPRLPLLLRAPGGVGEGPRWALLPFSIEASSLIHHEGFPEMLLALLLDLAGAGGPTVRAPGVLELAAGALPPEAAASTTGFDLDGRRYAEIESPLLLAGAGPHDRQAVAPPGPSVTAVNRTDWPVATGSAAGATTAIAGAPSWRTILLAAALVLVSLELWTRARGVTE